MSRRHSLKSVLKRGALIAAVNWQVTLIEATADSLFKLLMTTPIVGGVFLVAMVLGAEPRDLITLPWREMATTIASSLLSHPVVLAAFLLSVMVMAIGGSLFVFLAKAGSVAVLIRGDRQGGAIEAPPLHLDTVRRAAAFSAEFYIASARALFPRYARLGFMLMATYGASVAGYLALLFAGGLAESAWPLTALVTAGFVVWITLLNLAYLLMQIVVAADDCSVATAARRVVAFVRHSGIDVGAVFLVVFALVAMATAASVVATAALAMIAFVPFVGLTVLPLQLLAWLFRGLVFQFLGLSSVGAYLSLYRGVAGSAGDDRVAATVSSMGAAPL